MTLAAQIVQDVTTVFLNPDDFGETVTHYPLGVVASAVSRTGVFEEGASERIDDGHGERIRRTGTLLLLATVTATANERHSGKDTWLIAAEIWDTVTTRDEMGGQVIELERHEPIITKRTRAN